ALELNKEVSVAGKVQGVVSSSFRRPVRAVESSSCPLCSSSEEDIHHVLFGCGLAESIFRRICRWWELDWQVLVSFSD
ncbi:hypothetical protein Tco_1307441, partial [Tanacetum coccineum]